MQRLMKVSAGILVAILATPAPRNGPFEWPDPAQYWRVLVNVNQHVDFYLKNHPDYFARVKLVSDLAVFDVPPGGQDQAAKQYKSLLKTFTSRGIQVGTYVSGTTIIPEAEQNHYPLANVSIEQMPPDSKYVGSWPGHATRKIVSVADDKTRHALQAGIRQLWQNAPAPVRFVDNMPPPPHMGDSQPWEAACKHIEELGKIAQSQGSRVLFNIAMHVGELSPQQTQQLIHAVGQNGIVLEMPWHANIRKSKEATEKAQKRYRELLDSGMGIVMIPVNTPVDQLVAWVRTWKKPTDHLYLAGSFFERPDPSVSM